MLGLLASGFGAAIAMEPHSLPTLETVEVIGLPAAPPRLPPSLAWIETETTSGQGALRSTVTRDQLDGFNIDSVEGLAGHVPGLHAGMVNGGLSSALQLRGFALGRLHWNGLPDIQRLYARDLATVERIVVLRGPDAVLHGITAPGGVVHYLGKQPLHEEARHELETGFGSHGFWRARADTTGPLGDTLAYRLVGARQDGENRPGRVGLARWHGLGALSWRYRPGGSLTVEHEAQHNRRPFDFGTVRANGKVRYGQVYHAPGQTSSRRYQQQAVRWQDEITEHLTLAASYAQAQVQRDEVLFGFWTLRDAESLWGYYTDYRDRYRQHAWRTEASFNFETGPLAHRLTLGRDTLRHRLRFDGVQNIAGFLLDVDRPDFRSIDLDDLVLSPRYNREHHREHAWFLAEHIRLGDSLAVTLGWRRQHFSTRADRSGAGLLQASEGGADTWHAGIAFRLNDTWWHLTRSNGVEPNRGMTREGGFLDPQRAAQLELGARWQHDSGTRLDNLPMTDPQDRTALVSSGKRRVRGLDLSAARDFGRWNAAFNGSWQDTRNLTRTATNQGRHFPNVPRFSGALRLGVRHGQVTDATWESWVSVAHVGARHGDQANSFRLPAHQRIDAGTQATHGSVTLRLGIRNLADKRYVAVSNSVSDVHTGAPRSFWASIKLTL